MLRVRLGWRGSNFARGTPSKPDNGRRRPELISSFRLQLRDLDHNAGSLALLTGELMRGVAGGAERDQQSAFKTTQKQVKRPSSPWKRPRPS